LDWEESEWRIHAEIHAEFDFNKIYSAQSSTTPQHICTCYCVLAVIHFNHLRRRFMGDEKIHRLLFKLNDNINGPAWRWWWWLDEKIAVENTKPNCYALFILPLLSMNRITDINILSTIEWINKSIYLLYSLFHYW